VGKEVVKGRKFIFPAAPAKAGALYSMIRVFFLYYNERTWFLGKAGNKTKTGRENYPVQT
jgi:hypothetical protein